MPMPGGRDAVGGGVREKDNGSGAFVTGEAEGSDSVHVVQEVNVARVADGTHADIAWERSGGWAALGIHGPR